MKSAFQSRALAIVLALLTLGATVLAGLNLRQEASFEVPTDGVWWMEAGSSLQAERVPSGSPAEQAGVRTGDLLLTVNEHPANRVAALERELFRSGVWAHATYSVIRPNRNHSGPGTRLEIPIILEPFDRSSNNGFRLIALAYLCIGSYVLFRRWTAPKATHFYLFCLVSFILYSFKYTGELDGLDQVVFWANIVANALQPALFLHFAVSFNEREAQSSVARLRGKIASVLLYLPGALLVFLQYTAIYRWTATELLRHRLDQISVGYLAMYSVIAGIIFQIRYTRADSALGRQQLKWLTRGTFLAITPFTLFYAIPFMADAETPGALTKVAGLSLVILPLTFSWAIIRYRLMDTDLIFKRGVTYTLATASIVGAYFTFVGVSAEFVHTRLPNLHVWGLVAAVTLTGIVFEPLKRLIQGRVDRIFDQKRFDYRETLVEFGRGLNSQTDLTCLISSILERLSQTLLVTRVAVFLTTEDSPARSLAGFYLADSLGLGPLDSVSTRPLDLTFLAFDGAHPRGHIFWENPRQTLHLTPAQRTTAGQLDLNYYLPCRAAAHDRSGARTVAVIGLGLTRGGDFLSSEDVAVLELLASYIGIAIQNAQLYQRLENQIGEFERLKEFHENIVESINIGVFAVDLHGQIGSWNQQMEALVGVSRASAISHSLNALLPEALLDRFRNVRPEDGPQSFYKVRFDSPAGESRIVNMAIAPLLDKNAAMVGRIVLIDDITARVALEAQLAQSEKLSSIGLLAAGVAHEVNTPLAVISSYTQMLTKQMSSDARFSPILEKITQQSFRASEIVNGLLNFSRTSGTERSCLDLNLLLRDTVNLIDHQLKTGRITIDLDLDPALHGVLANQGKVQQVLLNLLLNAKDATFGSVQARVHLSTLNANGRVLVRVHDTGSGIREDHLHRIFDPFFTTKTMPREGEHKGTGLGLAVSYGIMQEHGGKICVQSTFGIGTTFELDFPAVPHYQSPDTLSERSPLHA